MEEIGIAVTKEVNHFFIIILEPSVFNANNSLKVEELDTKSFVISSQYEQLENDDLYTKFKVITRVTKY